MVSRLRKSAKVATVVALALLALTGFFAVGGASPRGMAHTPSPAVAGAHGSPAFAAHQAPLVHPSVNTVAVNLTNPIMPAWATPGSVWINFTVSTIGVSITAKYTNASIQMVAQTGSAPPFVATPYASWPVPVADGQTSFSSNVNASNVLPNTLPWVWPPNTWLPSGRYFFVAHVTAQNHTTREVASGSAVTSSSAGAFGTQYIVATPWAALNAPSPTGFQISPGNYTVIASYGGDWVSSAVLNISNPSGTDVFDAILTTGNVGNNTVILPANWLVVTPGTYTVKFTTVLTYNTTAHPSNTWTWTQPLNVTSGVTSYQPVYINQTQTIYTNSSGGALISGMSPGASAALLMVIGVIIGLIVALVLGRMMWGTTTTAPAQPWSGSKTSSTECSVCHQSFATEAEMKDHQKTAHGM
jgi:hypothetical protein